MKAILSVVLFLSIFQWSISQKLTSDTTKAGLLYSRSRDMLQNRQFKQLDSILIYSKQATDLYSKHRIWVGVLKSFSTQIQALARLKDKAQTMAALKKMENISDKYVREKNIYLADAYESLGILYSLLPESWNTGYPLMYLQKSLDIRLDLLGGKSMAVANSYVNMGEYYHNKGSYDAAHKYFSDALEIYKELSGSNNLNVAWCHYYIGENYSRRYFRGMISSDHSINNFNKSLENHFIALEIRKEILGEINSTVADSYNSIANIYYKKYDEMFANNDKIANTINSIDNEYDRSRFLGIDFELKSLSVREQLAREDRLDIAQKYQALGMNLLFDPSDYEKSIYCSLKALSIYEKAPGDNDLKIADTYRNLGSAYQRNYDYNQALTCYFEDLDIRKNKLKELDSSLYISYSFIGDLYLVKSEYDKSLESYLNSLNILVANNFPIEVIAMEYLQIGSIFLAKSENEKALEYQFKALEQSSRFSQTQNDTDHGLGDDFGEYLIGLCYNDIGNTYFNNSDFDLALSYYLMSLPGISSGGASERANVYTNLGNAYFKKRDFTRALEYFNKSIALDKPDSTNLLGDIGVELLSQNYISMGEIFNTNGESTKALEFFSKSLQINKNLFNEKHLELSRIYNIFGNFYCNQKEYVKTLYYYQKAICSNLRNFNDSLEITASPIAKDYFGFKELIKSFMGKAKVLGLLADSMIINKNSPSYFNLSSIDLQKLALQNLMLCDTIISMERKKLSKTNDKLAIGLIANEVYDYAIELCLKLAGSSDISKASYFNEKALYFSEQNKSVVLLEAITGREGLKFSGIPDTLLEREHSLMIEITFYEKKLAETQDSTAQVLFRSRLFTFNRQYEELIKTIENNYPEYYKLKYNTQDVTSKDLQYLLDDKTAIRAYFSGENKIYTYTLTKDKLSISQIQVSESLNDSITSFRYGLTKTYPKMQENYRRIGFYLFQKLFPDINALDRKIENLIIIPDGNLATIPFESLLTENYTGDINAYNEYPYLIKKYNFSYSYSANLFYQTYSKKSSSTIEITKLTDWLAFAPVFDNRRDQTMILSTRELQKQLNRLKTDSLLTNRSMFDRSYITPLPATETETEAIFNLYDDYDLKAKVLLYENANEQSIKSGELVNYKVLHFATHGFVNSELPELSGLLLAQDSTGGEDGVLFSGEIYNLKLNADLVVLSACETGLGKIQKGEGIIGLTRALLYAGAKNIIVSLWQVADESTSNLMVDFYTNSLASKGQLSYSEALRNAKLKMISEGKYSHPLFWSPFILIGR